MLSVLRASYSFLVELERSDDHKNAIPELVLLSFCAIISTFEQRAEALWTLSSLERNHSSYWIHVLHDCANFLLEDVSEESDLLFPQTPLHENR